MKPAFSPHIYATLGQLSQVLNCAERVLERDITRRCLTPLQVTSIPPDISLTEEAIHLNGHLLPNGPREGLLL